MTRIERIARDFTAKGITWNEDFELLLSLVQRAEHAIHGRLVDLTAIKDQFPKSWTEADEADMNYVKQWLADYNSEDGV